MQEAKVSQNIPWEKWNLLSPADISVLKACGFTLLAETAKERKKQKRSLPKSAVVNKSTAPTPHLLDTIVTCPFCKSKFHVYFKMVLHGNYLKSIRVSEEYFSQLMAEGQKVEVLTQTAITCEKCPEVLLSKPKEELILTIIRQRVEIKTGRRG
jgi:DNA-directed RNA polymerase subunit M/transcription elongation factor TFIIS